MARAVAKKKSSAMSFSEERPDFMNPGSMRGSENVGVDDLTIPRVDVLQDLSPQVKANKPEYIEGAEAGMLFNTVTNELYGPEITVVPVLYRKEWVVWKDRKKGGGFKGSYDSEDEAVSFMHTLEDVNDCEILDTGQHFCLLIPQDGPIQEVVISMAKSKAKVSRAWNSIIRIAGGDRFSRAYKIQSIEDQNANGDDYWNMKVTPLGYVTEEIFHMAESMYGQIRSGIKSIDHGSDTVAEEEPEL